MLSTITFSYLFQFDVMDYIGGDDGWRLFDCHSHLFKSFISMDIDYEYT